MPRFVSVSSFVLLIAFVFAGPVLALDRNEPPWRGEDGTTKAVWEFVTEGTPPGHYDAPDEWFGPGLTPPTMDVDAGIGRHWWDLWPPVGIDGECARQGVWPLSGIMVIEIPNYPPNPYKDIWVQITWASETQLPGGAPFVAVYPEGQGTGELVPMDTTITLPDCPDWFHSTYKLTIEPNPRWERIVIQGNGYVDEVVVDTRCYVPEPGGLLAMITGSLGLVGFVSRRKARR